MLKSQNVRQFGPEVDPLWLGKGCLDDDLSKPQVLIDTTFGDSHPGSRHLDRLADAAKTALYSAQCMPSVYTVTDICDGVATGHEGMNYSLISRDLICGMTEIHAMASGFDGLITISSCDKATPGHLMAIARLDIPAIHIPGGAMAAAPGFRSADSCYETNLRVAEGKMTPEEQRYVQHIACPGCGACQYMGTAATMQCMAEALGIALPGSATAPAESTYIRRLSGMAAKRLAEMIKEDLRPSQILTKAAFINAIKVHAAIGGSTNAVLHLPAIAKELGIEITLEDFDTCTKGIPLLTSVLTAGKWPTSYFWMAGGIPQIMRRLSGFLDLDVMTVTGKTLGENLDDLEKAGYFRRSEEMTANIGRKTEEIIRTLEDPADADSGVTILHGNIAQHGAVIKHCAVDKSMYHFVGRARVFDDEESAVEAIYQDRIEPGDVVVIRYVGKRAKGMPEMLKATDAICNKPKLALSTAIVTDGRFSGASRGPCVGYLLPEAAEGGAIGLLHENDRIEIDVLNKSIRVIGTEGQERTPEEIDRIFATRRESWQPKKFVRKGVLKYLDV
ncbi:MAG: dihydroxy-acid dehydratase [Eubacteriales bacterium]|nr:dihydroxy-acid dehydratase [Eubacteriales bacterium]